MKQKSILILFVVLEITSLILILHKECFFAEYLITLPHSKIWVHRVNSIEKLKEVIPCTNGVELDVVFDSTKDNFDVNHPPTPSINLSLSNYLSSIPHPENLGYWLDFKNLNEENSARSLSCLNQIVRKNHLQKEKIFIESDDPEALDLFYQNNYSVSYYLPVNSEIKNEDEFLSQYEKIKFVIAKRPELCISTNCRNYEIINKYFPQQKKLLWISGRANQLTQKESLILLSKMINDSNVLIILNQFQAINGNR